MVLSIRDFCNKKRIFSGPSKSTKSGFHRNRVLILIIARQRSTISVFFFFLFLFYTQYRINVVQWTPDLVDFKGPEKFVSYCRSLLLTISYNKKIKRKYFQGTFLFVYYWRSSLIAVVAKCRVHCTWINSKSVSKSQSQKLQVKRTLKQNNATIMINFMNFTN